MAWEPALPCWGRRECCTLLVCISTLAALPRGSYSAEADGDADASTSAFGTFAEPPIGRSHGTATLAWAWMWKPGGVALVAALMRVVAASAPCGVGAGAAVLG